MTEAPPVPPSSASCKRLLKEYGRLMRKMPPGIEAHPLDANILECKHHDRS